MSLIHPADPQENRAPPQTSDHRLLLEWLRDRDAGCPLCGYNLRELRTPRCPECGQELKLNVALAEPFLAPWIALLAALLPPAGVGSIFVCVFLNALLRLGSGHLGMGGMPAGVAIVVAHMVLAIPLSAIAIVGRRRFMRWERATQQRLAGAAWLADAMSLLIFLYEIQH